MKKLISVIIMAFLFAQVHAQINGNGTIKTILRSFDSIEELTVDINGKVEIYADSDRNEMEISYDENIVELVSTKSHNGKIEISQKEWIEGTQEVLIKIYTNDLQKIINDSWSQIYVYNLNQNKLNVVSKISTVHLQGKVNKLKIKSESSIIKAYDLEAIATDVTIYEDGKVYITASESLHTKIAEDGEVFYKTKPAIITGTLASQSDETKDLQPIDTKYVNVIFKNNSLKKQHAYVKGPKPDGNYFSYGLSFFPMSKKKERWTIGTKLYRVGLLGKKTLLHEVTADDEDKLVKLF